MTSLDLLFLFLALPILCAALIGYPLLVVIGMLVDRQEMVEMRSRWLSLQADANVLRDKNLLRPVIFSYHGEMLLRSITSSTEPPELLLRSSSSDEHSG
jgi:hypothetical protein